MNKEILDRVLRPEHKAIGLELELYSGLGVDLLLINKAGESLPIAVLLPTLPIKDIRHCADQLLEWSRSDIVFKQVASDNPFVATLPSQSWFINENGLCSFCGSDPQAYREMMHREHYEEHGIGGGGWRG